jgi:hypothetical protein
MYAQYNNNKNNFFKEMEENTVTEWPQPKLFETERTEILTFDKFTLFSLVARVIDAQNKVHLNYYINFLQQPKQIIKNIVA